MGLTGDAKREYQRRWIKARRDAWFEGKGCVRCGSTDRLEADHIDRSSKKYNVAVLWGMSDGNPAKVEELDKLQVLCYTCHKSKTSGEVEITEHGTVMYRKGCRCSACRSAATIDRRNYARRS